MKKSTLLTVILLLGLEGWVKADPCALNPEAYLYKNFADKLLLEGKRPEAVSLYKWASLLDPSYGNAHYNRAIALNEMGKMPEAREALNAYLQLCPRDPEALYNKGVLSLYLGDLETAQTCLSLASCHCKDALFTPLINEAIAFLVRYQECLGCCDKDGQKKLQKALLAFAQ